MLEKQTKSFYTDEILTRWVRSEYCDSARFAGMHDDVRGRVFPSEMRNPMGENVPSTQFSLVTVARSILSEMDDGDLWDVMVMPFGAPSQPGSTVV